MEERLSYGERGRIGLIVPSLNRVMEPELWSKLPRGVSLHANRVTLVDETRAGIETMNSEAVRAALQLADAAVSTILYGCTIGTIHSAAGDERTRTQIEDATGVPTVTVAGAVVAGLRELGAKRVGVVTPYGAIAHEAVVRFVAESGFEIAGEASIEHDGPIAEIPGARLKARVGEVIGGSDAVFVSCTGLPTFGVVSSSAGSFHVPVISSNSAGLWMALRSIGVDTTPDISRPAATRS